MALLDNYLNLITSEHRDKPNFISVLRALLKPSDDVFALAIYLDDYFDLDNATGAQQDIVGDIVGISRTLDFNPDKGLSPVLDNAAYRNLLKAKIIRNMWDGRTETLLNMWNALYDTPLLVRDNQDMTIDVCAIGLNDQISCNLVSEGLIIPRPLSVQVNYSFADSAVFSYDMETDTMKGYDEGVWADTLPTISFGYDTDSDTQRIKGYDEGKWT